ncbi:hypothetical protein QBC43DRAFT_223803 [Cladorrhinum sp. PSN259]|nr:hypothetical protein QBC43DRAFT_223803 [Cladorrhinum sp. PSN259]
MPPLPSNPAENAAPRIIGATMTVTMLALITYSARMYARVFMVRNLGLDDYFMSLAMALAIVGEGLIWGSTIYGAGRHMGDIPPEHISTGLKLNFISQPIFLIAICVVKLAVGSTLLRIATSAVYRRIIIGIMVFMSFYTIGCFFTIVLQCTNIAALWDPVVAQTATCWDTKTLQTLSYTNVALNILTDFCFAVIIPVPLLWGLQMNKRKRASLIVALGLGCFACAAAIAKIPSIVDYGKTGDWLWDSRDICIWTVVEANVGILAGSIPALRPLFKNVIGSSFKSKGTTGSGYKRHNDSTALRSVRGTRRDVFKSVSDETSSERGFNEANNYEMGNRDHDAKGATVNVFATVDGLSSDESIDRTNAHAAKGITKTTTTSVKFSGI